MIALSRKDVLEHFENHRRQLSEDQRDALVALYETFPESGRRATRSDLEARFTAAWRFAKASTMDSDGRQRIMAGIVAGSLGLSRLAHVRAIHGLYLSHGMVDVNRLALDLAIEPGEPEARLSLLRRAFEVVRCA